MLKMIDLPPQYVCECMHSGAGLEMQVRRSAVSDSVLLKFSMLPFLEIHQERSMANCTELFLNDSIVFPNPGNEDGLTPYLIEKLDATKGDPVAYIEVLMKYYHRALNYETSDEE